MQTLGCQRCSAKVFMALDAKRRTIAVDFDPFPAEAVPKHRRLILRLRANELPRVEVDDDLTPEVYVNHNLVCPGVVPERERKVRAATEGALMERLARYDLNRP